MPSTIMAVIPFQFVVISVFLILLPVTIAIEEYSLPYTSDTCEDIGIFEQFFNPVLLECTPCKQNNTLQKKTSDGYSCECQPSCKYTENYGGASVTCEKCPDGQVVTRDGWGCVVCPGAAAANNYNCEPCPGTYSPGDVTSIDSTTCAAKTYFIPNGNRCVHCINYNPTYTLNTCDTLIGGYCFTKTLTGTPDYNLPLPSGGTIHSAYLSTNLEATYYRCNNLRSAAACQQLTNMCVLALYEFTSSNSEDRVCNMYKKIEDTANFPKGLLPTVYYADSGDRVVEDTSFTTQYTFDPLSYFEFRLAKYSLDGKFLGMVQATGGLLQLCIDTTQKLNAAYTFGTFYSQSCSIPALELWDQTKYPLYFYEIFLKFTKNSQDYLYLVPLRIKNYKDGGQQVNSANAARDWVLTRRFFMVDNVASTGLDGTTTKPEYVRYAKSIEFVGRLSDALDSNGQIYPPYFTIDYDQVALTDAEGGSSVSPSFSVTYWMTQTEYRRDFQIATGTLATLGVLFAGYRTWAWSKRAGKLAIDFSTILNFMFFVCGSLANVFFIISFGISFYFMVFFKRQGMVHLFPIIDLSYREWLGLFGGAFALKCLQVAHMIIMQCTADIFLIDWERPKGGASQQVSKDGTKKQGGGTVSIWRTYFVANEWNEIQTMRKINHIFQIFAVVFFLRVVGFENVATKDPDGSVLKDSSQYQAEQSQMFRYGIAALVYLLVAIVQWIFFTFIYERFVEDKVRQFTDLCSMSNISVFVMAHAQFGYYIHGRSVHGKADTNMTEMCNMMKREEEDLCGQRGLLPNTEQQTFSMALPRKLRLKYEQVMLPVALETAGAVGAGGNKPAGSISDKQVEAYTTINRFLSAFVDHSLKDLDYVVKDKTLLESVMDTEFFDASEKGIFYNDNGHSFDECLFYGNEGVLIIFDTLLYCIIDLICKDFVLAGVITYLIVELISMARDSGGRKNLAKKTLVDERFLI